MLTFWVFIVAVAAHQRHLFIAGISHFGHPGLGDDEAESFGAGPFISRQF